MPPAFESRRLGEAYERRRDPKAFLPPLPASGRRKEFVDKEGSKIREVIEVPGGYGEASNRL